MKTKSKLLCAALAALCMIFAIALMPAAAAFADDRPAVAEYSRSAVSADERGILTIMNISLTSGNGSVTVTYFPSLSINASQSRGNGDARQSAWIPTGAIR